MIRTTGIIAVCSGVLGYGYMRYNNKSPSLTQPLIKIPFVLPANKNIVPSYSITAKPKCDTGDAKFTLFQYRSCPFCSKLRAYLDYHGFSYDVIEVNSVSRKELNWTPYKKVPVLLVQPTDNKDIVYQFNDSSMAISALTSVFLKKTLDLVEVGEAYPIYKEGKRKYYAPNKYNIMFATEASDEQKKKIKSERKWREWTDDHLVHTLSPNIYRTLKEALETFKVFDTVGEWEKYFSKLERSIIIYCGAFVMYFISKGLVKKYKLRTPVRASLYEACNIWLDSFKISTSKFHGGSEPDLSDLTVYGVLSSIEGTSAWSELIQNSNILPWYKNVKLSLNNETVKVYHSKVNK